MALNKITYLNKVDTREVTDRTKQAVSEDFNEIKTVVNALIDQFNYGLAEYGASTFLKALQAAAGLEAVGLTDLKDELKKTTVVIATDGTIDMGAGIMTALFTMTENTDFTFANPTIGKTFKALITGEFSHTWPDGIDTDSVFENYDGAKINIVTITPIQLGTTPIYQAHNEPK